MPVYVYCCPNRHHTEVVSSYQDRKNEVACEHCSEQANLILTAPQVHLEAISGAFPGAAIKWERNREQKQRLERKQNS